MSLTSKQEKFIQGVASGLSKTEAYRKAYDTSNMKDEVISVKANELFKNGKVSVRYEELKKEIKEKTFYTVEKANNDLEWIKQEAKKNIEMMGLKQANSNAYLNSVKQQIELNGLNIKDIKDNSEGQGLIIDMIKGLSRNV